MALEEPQIRADVHLCSYIAVPMLAAVILNIDNAVKHKHVGSGKLAVPRSEQLTAAAGKKILFREAVNSSVAQRQLFLIICIQFQISQF